jgi:hypothetical protein
MKIPKEPEPMRALVERLALRNEEAAAWMSQNDEWISFCRRCERAFHILRQERPEWADTDMHHAYFDRIDGTTVVIIGLFYDMDTPYEFDLSEVERVCPEVVA